jgi:hypothetical protein
MRWDNDYTLPQGLKPNVFMPLNVGAEAPTPYKALDPATSSQPSRHCSELQLQAKLNRPAAA